MDSVLDRVSDMILFSCLFWNLASQGETLQAALALLTLIVSLGVSQIRAEAEAVGVSSPKACSSGWSGCSRCWSGS